MLILAKGRGRWAVSPETDSNPKGNPFAQIKPTQRSVCSDCLKQRSRMSDCIALTEVTRLGARVRVFMEKRWPRLGG